MSNAAERNLPLWTAVARRPDFLLALGIGIAGITLLYYELLLRETTLGTAVARTAEQPVYQAAVAVLGATTIILFGLNFAVSTLLLRVGLGRRASFGAGAGTFVGAFAAGCPACGAFLLSLVGVGAGLAALPFAGLEVWLVAAMIIALTFEYASRRLRVACSGTDGDGCAAIPAASRMRLALLAVAGTALSSGLVAALLTNEV